MIKIMMASCFACWVVFLLAIYYGEWGYAIWNGINIVGLVAISIMTYRLDNNLD